MSEATEANCTDSPHPEVFREFRAKLKAEGFGSVSIGAFDSRGWWTEKPEATLFEPVLIDRGGDDEC